jgi:hypothetical protein
MPPETQRSRPGKDGSLGVGGPEFTTCTCGYQFHDEWEELQHRVNGRHHYRSRASLTLVPFAPLRPVRDLPVVDTRKMCVRCLQHADDSELVVRDLKYFHREGCST